MTHSEQSDSRLVELTHGRHCTCSACRAEDWTQTWIAPCGMHGASCERAYQPIDLPLGSMVEWGRRS